MNKEQAAQHARWVENTAFAVGVGLLAFAGVREAIVSTCEARPFPWVTFIIASSLVAPKMLGRVTAGRVWDLLGKKSSD